MISIAVLGAALITWLIALQKILPHLLIKLGMVRPNYVGNAIPVGMGLIIAAWTVPVYFVAAVMVPEFRFSYAALLTSTTFFALLGFMDDFKGNRSTTGLKGHLKALVTQGTVTTGLVKAVGGVLTALFVSYFFLEARGLVLVRNTILIALGANAINLLDLRPGRAGAISLVSCLLLLGLNWGSSQIGTTSILILMVPLVVLYEQDARARVMMGDSGSNVLGAAIMVNVIHTFPGGKLQWIGVAALVIMHLVAEIWSISLIIERTPILRMLDSFTGVRPKA